MRQTHQINQLDKTNKANKSHHTTLGIMTTLVLSTIVGIGIYSGISIANTNTTNALSYSTNEDISFTFAPTLSIGLSTNNLTIDNLVPGTTNDSNTVTVTVSSNTPYGYVLSAGVGSNNTTSPYYNTSSLTHENSTISNIFSSVDTNASLSSLTTDNTWGYSTSTDGGTSWSTYSGLSHTTTKPLLDISDPATPSTIDFKIAARSATTQASGTYNNVITFYAVGKPEPKDVIFTAGEHINTLMVVDSSKKWEPFYVTPESTGRSILFPDPNEGTKYIVTVVPEAGYVLSSDPDNSSWTKKSSAGTLASNTLLTTTYVTNGQSDNLTVSASQAGTDTAHLAYISMQDLTATQCPAYTDATQGINVTDIRNGKSYTVAKFGDYCYMLSNIRLDGGVELTVESGLSHVTADYTLPVDTGKSGWADDDCRPYMATAGGEYYYNWPAATARTNSTSSASSCSNDTSNSVGDICPAGWTLPTYQDITPAALWDGGANPGALSVVGIFQSGSQRDVGKLAYWTSNKRANNTSAYSLRIRILDDQSSYSPGRYKAYKHAGSSVRCMRNS